MTSTQQQPMSPEMRPEYARIPTLSLAVEKILDVLNKTHNIEQFISDEKATKERPFVLRAIDYTIKPQLAEITEPPTTTVSFPSSEQHHRIIQAEDEVKNAFMKQDDYGLSA